MTAKPSTPGAKILPKGAYQSMKLHKEQGPTVS
jgi:hypothetical protein